MQFIKTDDQGEGESALYGRLAEHLEKSERVLWLVPGGSNIQLAVNVMRRLAPALTPKLSILLTDERFGAAGHKDSNGAQLLEAGFDHKNAMILPVLVGVMTLEASRDRYNQLAREAFAAADYIVGQFGIGTDGHIAGILPESEAVEAQDFVAAFISEPYTRLTLTSHALKRLHVAFVFANGDNKRDALEQLRDTTTPYGEQPAQLLKELPEAYIYNDQIG